MAKLDRFRISLAQPSRSIDRFETSDLLALDETGVEVLAWDPRLERQVVLTVVSASETGPEALQAEKSAFALKAQLAQAVPQVPEIYDQGQEGDLFWVAREHVAGTSLSEVIAREAMPEARAVGIALTLATILEVLHDFSAEVAGKPIHGIVHGDIRPENVLLQKDDSVRLLDFGIARTFARTRRFEINLLASLPYSSPERLERGVIDRYSDLWAVGVMLATMVLGRSPFSGTTPEELEEAIRHGARRLPLPSGTSPGLVAIVDRSLAHDVAERYQSAAELKSDLIALRDGLPLPSARSAGSGSKAANGFLEALREKASGGRLLRLIDNFERAIREGLPFDSLEAVMSRFKLERQEVAALLHLSPRTLMRRKVERRLSPEESDRLVRVVRVIALASEVLDGEEHAMAWLRASNRALGGRNPLALIDIDLGVHQVEQVLGRIEHGVYS
jgi:putative toxin-antitoxin system antitoxin component (TIGR02293 family)